MESTDRYENADISVKVVSLDEQRKLRQQREDARSEETETTLSELSCESGVCVIQWRPKRPAA